MLTGGSGRGCSVMILKVGDRSAHRSRCRAATFTATEDARQWVSKQLADHCWQLHFRRSTACTRHTYININITEHQSLSTTTTIIISGFGIYGAAVVPDSGVGNTWQRLTLVLHEFLSNGLTLSRLHIVISFLTHADHVFLGLPRSLVPGSPNRVMELMQEVARCTCPYHLRRRVRRTAVISSRSSFWRSTN